MFVLAVLLGGRAARAQAPLRFETLSLEAGLSSVRVWDILQDRQGFLWVATGDGLNRYDGQTFTLFEPGGPGALSWAQVFDLYEDHDGTLWAGTYGGGLNRFDAATQTFTPYRHDPEDAGSLSDDRIRTIYESPRAPGILWIGTYGGGLNRFDTRTETWTHYRHDPVDPTSLAGDVVYAMLQDTAGTFWVATDAGLVTTTHGADGAAAFHRFAPADAVYGDGWSAAALVQDRSGNLWVGTGDAGLLRVAPDRSTVTAFRHDPADPTSLSDDNVLSLLEDRDGRIWVGTYGGGISLFDPATQAFTSYQHVPNDAASLGYDVVRALHEDRTGTVWVGTWGEGLSKVRRDKFRMYRHVPGRANSLLPGTVSAIAEDGAGGLWVGMLEDGLTYVAGAKGRTPAFRHFTARQLRSHTMSGVGVTALWPSPSNPEVVWIGTATGLARLDRRTGGVIHVAPDDAQAAASAQIRALEPACEPGSAWVGTEHGLFLFDEASRRFTPVPLPEGSVQTLLTAPDAPCRLWVVLREEGLFEVTPTGAADGRYIVRHHLPHVSTDTSDPYTVEQVWTQTSDDRLWLNGKGGLVAYDPASKSVVRYTRADGLPSDVIRSVLADEADRIWVATNRGLVRFDPAAGTFRAYDAADGLASLAFAPWARATGRDGTLYFGARKGLTIVHPGHLHENTTPPPVVLTDVRVFGRSLSIDTSGTARAPALPRHASVARSLVLPYDANVITFAFAALDFTAPQKNRYRYRLDGFDDDWQEGGTTHTATYTNLAPGTYGFRVGGTNNDGIWSEGEARLTLTVLPPWYRTRWAYLAYVLFTLGGLVAFVTFRERRLRRRAAVLEGMVAERTEQLAAQATQLRALDEAKSRFFANVTHEFRTPLTLIIGPLERALSGDYDAATLRRTHRLMLRNGQRLLRLINQLLDLARLDAGVLVVQPVEEDLVALVRRNVAPFTAVAEARRLDLVTEGCAAPLPHVFDPAHVETVLVNLLSNAIKFTPEGGTITVRLGRQDDGGVLLAVSDTGTGIAPEHLPRLFERFYQVEDDVTRRAEGTGIGLALVAQLVEAHGGRVGVESRVGEGTTFTVALPPMPLPSPAPEVDRVPEKRRGDGRMLPEPWLDAPAPMEDPHDDAPADSAGALPLVLLVEDNADLRAFVREQLEPAFRVEEAADGAEGLDRARALVPDLVVSDVMMPEMDGFSLLRLLREDRRTCHVPVLLLTARVDQASRLTGFETGAKAYLTKPFDAGELRVRADALVARQRQLRAAFREAVVEGSPAPSVPPLDAAFLDDVEAAVTAGLGDAAFGVDQLAEAVAMSRRQLLRKLDAVTGEAPGAFLRRRRLEHAAALLEAGYSVKETTDAVGFRSRVGFSRAFQEQYDVSPSDYART